MLSWSVSFIPEKGAFKMKKKRIRPYRAPNHGKSQFGFWLDDEYRKKLNQMSDEVERSVGWLVNKAVGKFLKEHKKDVRVVAVEPENRSALLGHEPGLHQIQGIGDGFIPDVLDVSLVDDIVEVSDEAAIETTRQLGRDFGLLVGISSGANVWAARQLAQTIDGSITTVLPDRAERYFSTALL